MPKTNIYRWQVPGNGNPFDTTLEDWKNENKYMSQRSIGILFFLKENNFSVSKKDFCRDIKNYLHKKFNNPINNSCVTDFYRPLEFLGLINRFGNKKDSILNLSIDGKNFLNEIISENYDKAKDFLILQMLKTKYPNTAAQDVKLNLFPFRILFKILLEHGYIDDLSLTKQIPYIKNIDDLKNFKNINEEKYLKWKTWIIPYLVRFNVLSINENKISISSAKIDFIRKFLDDMQYDDMFFDTIEKEMLLTNNIKKRHRNNNLINEVIQKYNYKCFFNKNHTTFPTQNRSNYVEGHHIIPISLQDSFLHNLDIENNIIPLCPNCHKAIHLATNQYKEKLLNYIIENTNIKNYFNVTISDLKEIYFTSSGD